VPFIQKPVAILSLLLLLVVGVGTVRFVRTHTEAGPCEVLTSANLINQVAGVDWAPDAEPRPVPLVRAVQASFRQAGVDRTVTAADLDPIVQSDSSNVSWVGVGDRYVQLLRQGSGYIPLDKPRSCAVLSS